MAGEYSEKVRERRARRRAERRGLILHKSRRRDDGAIEFGGYLLRDATTDAIVIGYTFHKFDASLEEIEAVIADWNKTKDRRRRWRARPEPRRQAAHVG